MRKCHVTCRIPGKPAECQNCVVPVGLVGMVMCYTVRASSSTSNTGSENIVVFTSISSHMFLYQLVYQLVNGISSRGDGGLVNVECDYALHCSQYQS